MLEAVSATYDGKTFVLDEDLKLSPGQKVIITVLEPPPPRKKIDFAKYAGSAGKIFNSQEEADKFLRSLRQ